MTEEEYQVLKKSGTYKKEAKMLLELNDLYLKYLYLYTFNNIEAEKERLRGVFQKKSPKA